MAIWLIRAGSHGEYEQKFIQDKRVYVTWDDLQLNIANLADRQMLIASLTDRNPNAKPNTIRNWSSQIWPFAHEIAIGDLIILPLKSQPAIQIGEVTGDYHFENNAQAPYWHYRSVEWVGEAIPRDHFGQDPLHSFSAPSSPSAGSKGTMPKNALHECVRTNGRQKS